MKIRIVLIFLLALCLSAVWKSDGLLADESVAGSHRRASPEGAEVGFVTPMNGDVVAPNFSVEFFVKGMGITPAGTDIENTGHHHLLIDVDELPDPNLPLPKNEHFVHFGGGQTETELALPVGEHSLQLYFADYAHIPHNPVVISERITITVSLEAPVEMEAVEEN